MCRVLYMVLERHIDFRHKIAKMMTKGVNNNFRVVECKKPLILDVQLVIDSRSGNSLSILKNEIEDFKADVVILDSRYKTTSREEKDEEATKCWISNIEYLIENTGCTCIVIHHSPKNEYTELVNRAVDASNGNFREKCQR